MAKKKEKIVEQLFAIDLKKNSENQKLPSGLRFLKNVKFHSIAVCKSSTSTRLEKRILLLPHQVKKLLEINSPAIARPESNALTVEIESLKMEIRYHIAEIAMQKETHSEHEKTIQSLRKRIDELPCHEVDDQTKTIKTNATIFDNAAHLLRGLPLRG